MRHVVGNKSSNQFTQPMKGSEEQLHGRAIAFENQRKLVEKLKMKNQYGQEGQ